MNTSSLRIVNFVGMCQGSADWTKVYQVTSGQFALLMCNFGLWAKADYLVRDLSVNPTKYASLHLEAEQGFNALTLAALYFRCII